MKYNAKDEDDDMTVGDEALLRRAAKLRFNRRKDLQLAYEEVGLGHQERSGKFYVS